MADPTPILISVVGIRKVEEYKLNALAAMQQAAENPTQSVVTRLVPEPSNPWDSLALAVAINDRQVGYVPKSEQQNLAARFPDVFKLGCYARVTKWGATEEGPYIEIEVTG